VSAGAIHDLGYKRYLGTRKPQSTRWRVIVRNQVGAAWKTWWRYKMALGFAVIAMIVFGALIYVTHFFPTGGPGRRMAFLVEGDPLDGWLSMSVRWFCYAGFLVGLTVASGTIAADQQVGAFTFYFARPVRPIDYVLGKLGGLFLLQMFVMAAPLVVLAAFRCGMVDSTDDLVRALPAVGKALATGVIGAAAYAAVPLGLSSLAARRRNAIALWAAYYMLVCNIFYAVGREASGDTARAIGQLDLQSAVTSVGAHLFGAQILPSYMHVGPLAPAIVSLTLYIGGGVALAWWQVSARASAGVGGG
jgi:hypothetical protein